MTSKLSTPTLVQAAGRLLSEKYGGVPSAGFRRDLKRLQKGEPLQYVIGWADFLGCRVDLRFRPFIPRPETEYWVNEAIKTLPRAQPIRCLDLFAGAGGIGLALLKNLPRARVDFGELDTKALKQIRGNLKLNKLNQWARVIKTDIFSAVKAEYDFILANPPYVATGQKHKVQKRVLKHEPPGALFAGPRGLFYLARLLKEAPGYLKPGGVLLAEFDPAQRPALARMLKQFRYQDVKFFKDQYGRWRYLRAGRP